MRIFIRNGDGMGHDLVVPELGIKSATVSRKGDSVEVTFTVDSGREGTHAYSCSIAGHRQAGMEGRLIVR